ncbi:MAG: hypothetical protein AABX00_04730 [Nanoarchaeota archaeon]
MNIEKPYLLLFFGLMLFLGVSNLMDHRVQHDFPYAYLASDTFQQQTRADGIADAGNYRNEPFYIVKGFKDVVGYYPPLVHHLGVLLHFTTGIPAYDTVYFMVFFSAILAAFVMYIIIRSYNKNIAILSLPLSILIFSDKSYIGFVWGHWASITGQLFLLCIFWSITRFDIAKSEALLGIFMGSLALAHTSELIYGIAFVGLYGVWLLSNKKLNTKFFKKTIIAAVIAIVISAYSLYIFYNSFMVVNPYTFEVSKYWGGTPIFEITDFSLLLIFMVIGLIAGILMIKKIDVPVLAGIFMLLVGYTNYIGFGIRAFQPRLFWPIYFSIFLGIGLHTLVKYMPFNSKAILAFCLSAFFVLAISNTISIPNIPTYSKLSNPGIMDTWHWQMFQWISKNTDTDSKIYFFYGDIYGQDAILRNSKRLHVQVIPDDFIAALQNRTVKRVYWTEAPADHGAGFPHFSPFPKIKLYLKEDTDYWLLKSPNIDICKFDYLVFDRATRQEVLAQYNLVIANQMMKKDAQVVFQNEVSIILKNNKVNGDCIEEGTF